MDKLLLGTNWKMHKTLAEAIAYIQELKELVTEVPDTQFFVIPPYTVLWQVQEIVDGTNILLGAQNMHWEDQGAYTGEISPRMLTEIGVNIIEIGHSERRQYYNETDYTVNKKVLAALKHGLTPLICIGEQGGEKEYGVSQEAVAKQLKIALKGVSYEDLPKVWIAYEPVWAIGANGTPATPEYVGEMHTYIRQTLVALYAQEQGSKVPLLYGGSVNHDNCRDLLSQPNVDGLFIGRAAWDAKSFREIVDLLLGLKLNETYEI